MSTRLCILVLAFTFVLTTFVMAQSTSPWQKAGEATFGDTPNPTPGNAYMTVFVRAATVYQNSNWWTNFVERNRQSVLTVNLNGTIAGNPVSLTKTGTPVTLPRNNSMVDLGYSGIVVDHLPTTFSSMNFNLQINKTAQDGLQGLMNQVAHLSAAQPPVLSVSQQAIGIANLTKSIADFLFHANLLVQKMATQSPIPANGLLAPGIYVCFAGDSRADYERYLTPATPGLKWSGSQLTYNNDPVGNITYFVVEVGYQKHFFSQLTDSLSFGRQNLGQRLPARQTGGSNN